MWRSQPRPTLAHHTGATFKQMLPLALECRAGGPQFGNLRKPLLVTAMFGKRLRDCFLGIFRKVFQIIAEQCLPFLRGPFVFEMVRQPGQQRDKHIRRTWCQAGHKGLPVFLQHVGFGHSQRRKMHMPPCGATVPLGDLAKAPSGIRQVLPARQQGLLQILSALHCHHGHHICLPSVL